MQYGQKIQRVVRHNLGFFDVSAVRVRLSIVANESATIVGDFVIHVIELMGRVQRN